MTKNKRLSAGFACGATGCDQFAHWVMPDGTLQCDEHRE
jgi:hypothetical protein